jgi:hypothetical protein
MVPLVLPFLAQVQALVLLLVSLGVVQALLLAQSLPTDL